MGQRAQVVLRETLSQQTLCARFCNRLELAIYGSVRQAAGEASESARAEPARITDSAATRLAHAV
jgi:hypothetical protein